MMSGGVFTVSSVGVRAVTYMPYSGYRDISVVTISTSHTTTLVGVHLRAAGLVLDITAQHPKLNDRHGGNHDEQHERLRGGNAIAELHESVLVDLRHHHLCA